MTDNPPNDTYHIQCGEHSFSVEFLRTVAADLHGGQASPFYAFSSTGTVMLGLAAEARRCIEQVAEEDDETLNALMAISVLGDIYEPSIRKAINDTQVQALAAELNAIANEFYDDKRDNGLNWREVVVLQAAAAALSRQDAADKLEPLHPSMYTQPAAGSDPFEPKYLPYCLHAIASEYCEGQRASQPSTLNEDERDLLRHAARALLRQPVAGSGDEHLVAQDAGTVSYHGLRDERGRVAKVVRRGPDDAEEQPLPLCLHVANHSPSGFEWGYGGSGPAQLALAILLDYAQLRVKDAPVEWATSRYQYFNEKVIACLPQWEREQCQQNEQNGAFCLTEKDILAAIHNIDKKKPEVESSRLM